MSYTIEDLDRLDALLQALPQDQMPMSLSELNGYLTGILAAPDLIMPSEWLDGVWSEDGAGELPDPATAEKLVPAVMEHYNDIAALIYTEGWIEPIYEEDPNSGETLWEPWIDGFTRAMGLRPAQWLAVAEGPNEDAALALNMIIVMQDIGIGTTELSEAEIDEIDRDGPDLIPNLIANILVATQQINPFAADEAGISTTVLPFHAPKRPGRNDPCPCGSGRKYKHCCGLN